MKAELESTRDEWRQQCEEEIEKRLEEKEVEVEKRLEEKEAEMEKKVKEAEEKVKALWAADLTKLRQSFQVN